MYYYIFIIYLLYVYYIYLLYIYYIYIYKYLIIFNISHPYDSHKVIFVYTTSFLY